MKKDKATIQWGILILLSFVWVGVLAFLYPTLPDAIPIHFSLSGNVGDTANKSTVFTGYVLIFSAYMIYTWFRYKKNEIPMKNLITLYFLMIFSVFIVLLGQYLS